MDKECCNFSADGGLCAQNVLQFTIMSYNILADTNLKPDMFKYVQKDFLNFEYRSKLIIDEIQSLQPDIIGFQELDHYSEFYEKQLGSLGYESYYEMKVPDEEGIALAWKKGKFVEKTRGVRKLKGEQEDEYAKKQLAIYLELEPVGGGPSVKVVNLHLFWDYKKENIKYFQAMKVLKWLDDEYKLDDNIIICGDFNSIPKSNVMNLMFGDGNEIKTAHNPDALKELVRLHKESTSMEFKKKWKSAYDSPKFTVFTEHFHETLDYIIFNELSALKLVKLAPLMSAAEASKEKGLPNSVHGSDHVPLLATFGIPKESQKPKEHEQHEPEPSKL